jgi:hypothetical protein
LCLLLDVSRFLIAFAYVCNLHKYVKNIEKLNKFAAILFFLA